MDFDFNDKIKAVAELAKTCKDFNKIKAGRDRVHQEAYVYINNEIDKIKKSLIPIPYRQGSTFNAISFKSSLQNYDLDQLEEIANKYIETGIVKNADIYDFGAVSNLVNELRSRKSNYLHGLADKVIEADKNYCTSEPWKKNSLFNELEALRNILTAADPEAFIDDKGKVLGKISDLTK